MANDTQAPRRRTNVLFRRVVVPTWVQTTLLVLWAVVMVQLIAAHPLLAFLVLAVCAAFSCSSIGRRYLRAGRRGADYNEVQQATTMRDALDVTWRQMRTYPVWLLVIVALASIDVVLGWLGLPTF